MTNETPETRGSAASGCSAGYGLIDLRNPDTFVEGSPIVYYDAGRVTSKSADALRRVVMVSAEDAEFLRSRFGSDFFQHPLSIAEIDQVSSALKEKWADGDPIECGG